MRKELFRLIGATPESINASRPFLPPLPANVVVRIHMPPRVARGKMSGAPSSGSGAFGVTYLAPGAKPETAMDLMHGELHSVDTEFGRKLVQQGRAVLLLDGQEFVKWPIERLPMDQRERDRVRELIQARAR